MPQQRKPKLDPSSEPERLLHGFDADRSELDMDSETKRLHDKAERIGEKVRSIRGTRSDEVPPPPSLAKVKALLRERESAAGLQDSQERSPLSLLWMLLKPAPLASLALVAVLVWGALPWFQNETLTSKHKPLASQPQPSSARQNKPVAPHLRSVQHQGTKDVNVDEYVKDWERTAMQVVAWADSKELEEEAVALGNSATQVERDRLAFYQEDDGFQAELPIAPISQKLPPALQSLEGLAQDLSPSLSDMSLMSL